jgi:hypothetical protein|tara:strand:- start:794 stop:1483 length:690 start_codon:yes stop_codon:yes gene_type:complete
MSIQSILYRHSDTPHRVDLNPKVAERYDLTQEGFFPERKPQRLATVAFSENEWYLKPGSDTPLSFLDLDPSNHSDVAVLKDGVLEHHHTYRAMGINIGDGETIGKRQRLELDWIRPLRNYVVSPKEDWSPPTEFDSGDKQIVVVNNLDSLRRFYDQSFTIKKVENLSDPAFEELLNDSEHQSYDYARSAAQGSESYVIINFKRKVLEQTLSVEELGELMGFEEPAHGLD